MKQRLVRIMALGLLCLGLALALAACAGPQGAAGPAGPAGPVGAPGETGPQGAQGEAAVLPPGPGLQVKITGVEFPSDGKPVVSLTITDAAGTPLKREALEGYGFSIAQIVIDDATKLSKYQSLLLREVKGQPYAVEGETKQPALATAIQPFADSGGPWKAVDLGYTYTFTNTLTLEADPILTTVVGMSAYKDGRTVVANDVYTFVPAGGEPTVTREVVTTAACGACHNPIMIHGGTRRETGLCVTCHTDQNTDPETGNTVDFKVLIHRLHSGTRLPSVAAGTVYQIVGNRQNVFNFSLGTWPQDTRNCTTCHSGGAQSDHYKTAPNTAACTSCHDNVNLATGENHPGGKVTDEAKCAACHEPDGEEFDASVTGAHVIPAISSKVKGVKLEIVSVEGAVADGSPVVTFKVTDNSGAAIAPADMDYLAVTLAGPTSDYTNRVTETIFRKSTDPAVPSTPPVVEDAGSGAYRYTFTDKIPADATGTYAVGMEGYVMETIEGVEVPVRVAAFNPVAYVSLTGGNPVARRKAVDREKCNACHSSLALHGTVRQNTEYCVLCHNPTGTDEARRPAEAMPPTSINFRVLIHRLHRGEEANNPLVVYGFGGRPIDFGNVIFPGNLAACQTCHVAGTYGLPLPGGVQPTTVTQAGKVISTTLPIRSVCTACHDSTAASGHVELQTTGSGIETCAVCHGAGREFDVTKVHR
ncbi:MAG: OmcA/MtrC family decaheme c-type cytochrome [Chloroflexi bacterium]|nr:OmcA/MtrC family decaheme c-type cytochrome [Chloroflexota bacterium]